MIDEWGIVVLFSLGAGSLQSWIASSYNYSNSGLFLGISFLVTASYLKRRKEKKTRAG